MRRNRSQDHQRRGTGGQRNVVVSFVVYTVFDFTQYRKPPAMPPHLPRRPTATVTLPAYHENVIERLSGTQSPFPTSLVTNTTFAGAALAGGNQRLDLSIIVACYIA